jgi:uncharacterized membrane-anchored protein YhcB (DUF1043 family)
VLKGKYDAEVPRMQHALRQQAAQINHLNGVIAQLSQAPADATPAAPGQEHRYVRPEDVEEYGQDMIDVAQRAAREVFEPQLQQVTSQLSQAQFDNALLRAVPNWEVINQDPVFWQWLDQMDPYTGQVRRTTLQQAFADRNAEQATLGFQAFIQDYQASQQAAAASAPQQNPQLAAQQQPTRNSATAAPAAGRTYTRAQISQFYREVTQGRYRGREPEAKAIEDDINKAMQEGRLVG